MVLVLLGLCPAGSLPRWLYAVSSCWQKRAAKISREPCTEHITRFSEKPYLRPCWVLALLGPCCDFVLTKLCGENFSRVLCFVNNTWCQKGATLRAGGSLPCWVLVLFGPCSAGSLPPKFFSRRRRDEQTNERTNERMNEVTEISWCTP